ncbi:hypothetical protein [Rossellomorea marisflavi]|nr:hypothetical protein [Rossellomorea marisflavi]
MSLIQQGIAGQYNDYSIEDDIQQPLEVSICFLGRNQQLVHC